MTTQTRPARQPNTALYLLLLVLILLLAGALRTHALDTRSLWADEGWTLVLSEGPSLADVTQTLAADQHPPLFFMGMRLWRDVTGETEFALRYLSVLIGLIAVAGVYQLGRTLFTPWIGLIAALLLALSDLHIDLSQEVRHYAALTTLAVLQAWFYGRWWHKPSPGNRVGVFVSGIALLYTHYLGGFLLLAELIHMLVMVRPWRRLADALFLFGSTCLGFLPWLPVVIDQNRLRWDNPLYYQNSLPNSPDTYRAVREALLGSHYGLMAGLAVLGLVTLVSVRRGQQTATVIRWRPWWPTSLMAIWAIFLIALTVIINARSQFLTVRNFILITPALAVLIAHGLSNLPRTARLFLIAIITIVSLTTVDARRHYPDWRSVTRQVTDNHLPGEPVLMDVWVGDFPVRYYVAQQMDADTPAISLREWRDTYRDQFLQHLAAYLAAQDAFWLVYWGDDPMDEYGDLIAARGFQQTAALHVVHEGTPLYSYRYDRLDGAPLAGFGELFALRKAYVPPRVEAGSSVSISLWWTAEQPVPLDYSVSVFLLGDQGLPVAIQDGPPLNGESPTSAWEPGRLQYDTHRVDVPADVPPGTYEVGVRVYWYGDVEPLRVIQAGEDAGDYLAVGTITVEPVS